MRRWVVGIIGAGLAVTGIACLWRWRHSPKRVPLIGGFRCEDCGRAGADLDDMGHHGEGYVRPDRREFDRERYRTDGRIH